MQYLIRYAEHPEGLLFFGKLEDDLDDGSDDDGGGKRRRVYSDDDFKKLPITTVLQ